MKTPLYTHVCVRALFVLILSSGFCLEGRLKRRNAFQKPVPKSVHSSTPSYLYTEKHAEKASTESISKSASPKSNSQAAVTYTVQPPAAKTPVPKVVHTADACAVKVLLDEKNASSGHLWTLKAEGDFVVTDLHNNRTTVTIKGPQLQIGARNGNLFVNSKRLASSAISITSKKGPITYGDYAYNGTFLVVYPPASALKGGVRLINKVELEDYVACGVRWEMLPGWPAAALEAGAIAYRTYVITTLRSARAKHKNKLRDELLYSHDIRSTPVHQTYKGTHNCKSIYDAVQATKGLILTHNGEPIVALYDACCGGSVPARRSGAIDLEKAPYLARTYACNHCSHYKFYNWTHTYTLPELADLLSGYLRKKGPISAVKITKKDKAGAVQEFQVKIRNEWVTIPGAKFVALAKKLRSCTLSLSRRGSGIEFTGKGDGHQYGFCQWGAHGMARKGLSCKRILQFYYPGTSLMKVDRVL